MHQLMHAAVDTSKVPWLARQQAVLSVRPQESSESCQLNGRGHWQAIGPQQAGNAVRAPHVLEHVLPHDAPVPSAQVVLHCLGLACAEAYAATQPTTSLNAACLLKPAVNNTGAVWPQSSSVMQLLLKRQQCLEGWTDE